MKPPSTIDGARVLWWAWAGDRPFGYCSKVAIYGFAIGRYDDAPANTIEPISRLSCDGNWQTVNDDVHVDEDEAKSCLPVNYSAALARILWIRFEPTR